MRTPESSQGRSCPLIWFSPLPILFLIVNIGLRATALYYTAPALCWFLLPALILFALVLVFPNTLAAVLGSAGFSLVFFGFHSHGPHNQVFELMLCGLALGLVCSLAARPPDSGPLNPLKWLLLLYGTLALLSLALFPVPALVRDLGLHGWSGSGILIFNSLPGSAYYSIAGVNRLALFILLAWTVALADPKRQAFTLLFAGMALGTAASVLLALLDHYKFLSLSWYNLDPKESRLEGFFRNPGWFAEYTLVSLPFALPFLADKKKWIRLLAWPFFLAAATALFLTLSRTAWAGFMVVAFLAWIALPYFRPGSEAKDQKGTILRRAAVAAVGVPLAVAVLVGALYYGQKVVGGLTDDPVLGTKIYRTRKRLMDRFSNISESRRSEAWRRVLDVGANAYVFGLGYETFRLHMNAVKSLPNAPASLKQSEFIRDSAHNFYLQLYMSNGLAGLMLWLAVILFAAAYLVADFIREKRSLNLCVLLSLIAFHFYGLAQSMQYVSIVWLVAFLNLGYCLTLPRASLPKPGPGLLRVATLVLGAAVLCAGVYYAADSGFRRMKQAYDAETYLTELEGSFAGFHAPETWPSGEFRWFGEWAEMDLPSPATVGLDVFCAHQDMDLRPFAVAVTINGKPVDTIEFNAPGMADRRYALPKGRLGFRASRIFTPMGRDKSIDFRDMGAAVGNVATEPCPDPDWIGFYAPETGPDGVWRWSCAQGIITLPKTGRELILRCAHPDVARRPVTVELSWDTGPGETVVLASHVPVLVSLDGRAGSRLGLSVSRTWVPSAHGQGGENRALGIAARIRE